MHRIRAIHSNVKYFIRNDNENSAERKISIKYFVVMVRQKKKETLSEQNKKSHLLFFYNLFPLRMKIVCMSQITKESMNFEHFCSFGTKIAEKIISPLFLFLSLWSQFYIGETNIFHFNEINLFIIHRSRKIVNTFVDEFIIVVDFQCNDEYM